MNASVKKVVWMMMGAMVVVTTISALIQSRRGDDAKKALEDTQRELREQGFKTDEADFDFATDDATRARMAVLTFLEDYPKLDADDDEMDFLPRVSDDTADIVWKQDAALIGPKIIQWADVHGALDTNREALDAACEAAMSGPIRFENLGLTGKWDDHISKMHTLSRALNERVLLELHEGNPDAAWTNLFAATRLVTAWDVGPELGAHLVRSGIAEYNFNNCWQLLQYHNWPDAKLEALQKEWESVDYFTNLTEPAALLAVYDVKFCNYSAGQDAFSRSDFLEVFHSPSRAWSDFKGGIEILQYRGYEELTDQRDVLLYFHNRELELRQALKLTNWMEMRKEPGITNDVDFSSKYPFLGEFTSYTGRLNFSLLSNAATSEAMRRVLITAIALERYRGRHGAYPATLAKLAPEFLKEVPVDFMDGKPLRYRLADDGHFVLYSVGLDCVDDGGKMPLPDVPGLPVPKGGIFMVPTNVDIVWPRPVSISTASP